MPYTENERRLTSIETIASIHPITDAERIERARVKGWDVVVSKGRFTAGDEVLYVEIDALIPTSDPRLAFLATPGSTHHRLRTARMRGVHSQGLVLPIEDFEAEVETARTTGASLDELLGITRYEPPIPLGDNVIGGFHETVRKTGSERIQNLDGVWQAVASHSGGWVATEKIDGTSCTVSNDGGTIHVFSRNFEVAPSGPYAVALETLAGHLEPGDAIQCEVAGPGIQSNRLGLDHVRVFVFDVLTDARAVPYAEWPDWALEIAAPVHPEIVLDGSTTIDRLLAQVDDLKSLVTPTRRAEGVVLHTADGLGLPELDGRSSVKIISNRYLLKTKD